MSKTKGANKVLLWPKLFFGYVFYGKEVRHGYGYGIGPNSHAHVGDGFGTRHYNYIFSGYGDGHDGNRAGGGETGGDFYGGRDDI